MRRAFRCRVQRRQRRSDGTISLEGKRFEVPARFRHLESLHVAYARWDLSAVELVDPHTGTPLCPLYPLDKAANASGQRRRLAPVSEPEPTPVTGDGAAAAAAQAPGRVCRHRPAAGLSAQTR